MKRIKILQVAQAAGGVQKHILHLVKGLNKERFEVIGAHPSAEPFRKANIKTVAIDMRRQINPVCDLSSFFKIFNLIRKEKFDIVHTHSSKAGFLGRLAARMLGTPVILYTPHAFAFDRPEKLSFQEIFYLWLERLAGRWCDMIVAVSESERDLALRHKVASPDKITAINNAIDPCEFAHISTEDNIRKRQSLGVDEKTKIVITTARLSRQKAPLDFVKAAKYVVERKSDVRFFIAGDGPLIKRTKTFIKENRLEDYVILLGWRADVKELVSISDVFILTSLWEGMPYAIMEAMALKKPIVATNVTGTRDLIKDGYNGYLVPPDRPEALGEKVLKLLRDPHLSREMGNRGCQVLEEKTNLKEHIKAMENLYTRLLNQKLNRE